MIDMQTIERMATKYPGTQISTSYGTPAVKVGKKLMLRLHQKEDAIVVMLDSVAQQKKLIKRDPLTFYITDHYNGYAAVLVRPTVSEDEFDALLEQAWRRVATKKTDRRIRSNQLSPKQNTKDDQAQ